MFSTRNLLLAGALLAVSAPALAAQQGGGYGQPRGGQEQHGQRGERGQRGMRSPVQALVEHRGDLGLSDDQVGRLRQIDTDLQRRTEPLRQQLEQYRGNFQRGQDGQQPSEQDRDAMRQRMEQARPVFEQLRKANQDAMQRALAVLTPEQRETAKSLMPQRGERGERGGRGQGGGTRQGQGGSQQSWNRGGSF
jgi:Spy/CpxP family protein refolding chaperone